MKCPNCKKESITFFRRLNLRPGKSYKCKVCGKSFFISQIHSVIALMPMPILVNIQIHLENKFSSIMIGQIIAVIIVLIIYRYCVPLLPEKNGDK